MSIVAKIQNNEFPGFYSAIAQIDHPVWAAQGVANLIRHYADDDPLAVGSFVVFNSVEKVYEKLILRQRKFQGHSEKYPEYILYAYRSGKSPEDNEFYTDALGKVDVIFRDTHYGPELPLWRPNPKFHAVVLRLDSFCHALEGMGTLLMQAAFELAVPCEWRLWLLSGPDNHPFYVKWGMRWADRPNRIYDPEAYDRARNHLADARQGNSEPDPQMVELCERVEKLQTATTEDFDEIVLKEIENAKREGRKPDASKLVKEVHPGLYLPDDGAKVWKDVIAKRPVLYKT